LPRHHARHARPRCRATSRQPPRAGHAAPPPRVPHSVLAHPYPCHRVKEKPSFATRSPLSSCSALPPCVVALLLLARHVEDRRARHRSSRHAAPASPPRAVPWHRAADHQAVPARSHQNRADTVLPRRESTALSTPHLRSFLGPADHATSFASSPCCSPTTLAPTSATPSAPHRRSSPLDVHHREAAAVMRHSPPCCLQSVHLNADVLCGHFPHCLAPPARRISASSRMAAAAACARRHARARAGSWEPTEGLGHQAGSAC
jgi:hypothetical protein